MVVGEEWKVGSRGDGRWGAGSGGVGVGEKWGREYIFSMLWNSF